MEVIFAIGLIITALVSSLALISFSVSSTTTSRSKIIAIGLSQEGLEIVRSMRDGNWLQLKRSESNWRDDLNPGIYRVEYDRTQILPYTTASLYRDSDGFYFYIDQGARTNSVVTPFQREITIEHIDTNQLRVISEVKWQERGRNNTIKAETRLYNWMEES